MHQYFGHGSTKTGDRGAQRIHGLLIMLPQRIPLRRGRTDSRPDVELFPRPLVFLPVICYSVSDTNESDPLQLTTINNSLQADERTNMASTSRTFRIFVSSTFSDLKAERNIL